MFMIWCFWDSVQVASRLVKKLMMAGPTVQGEETVPGNPFNLPTQKAGPGIADPQHSQPSYQHMPPPLGEPALPSHVQNREQLLAVQWRLFQAVDEVRQG